MFFSDIDLAIFNHSFWTTVHQGGILQNTLEFKDQSHLGIHFSPILLTLIPVYMLLQDPGVLIISQTLLLSLGVVPIYLLATEKLGRVAGCGIGLLYLVYPALHGVNMYDFHEVAFLPFLLGMGLWGYVTGRKSVALIFCLLCLLVKEDTFPIICMIGLIGLISLKSRPLHEKWQYLLLLVLPLLTFFLYSFVVKPLIYGGDLSDGTQALSQYVTVFSNLSSSNDSRLMYVFMLLSPLLFLPLFTPKVLIIGIPSFLEILLSPNSFYYNINSHYSAPLIPILFVALIFTLEKITKGNRYCIQKHLTVIVLILIGSSVISSVAYSPAVQEFKFMISGQTDLEKHVSLLESVIQKIPMDASVSTQDNIAAQLSNRWKIWHDYHPDADYVLIDTAYPQSSLLISEKPEIERDHLLAASGNGILLYVHR